MTITVWRYPNGDEHGIDTGRPWPAPGDPWRARTPEFATGAIRWLWDHGQPARRWQLVDAPPRTIVWLSALIAWVVDGRADSAADQVVILRDGAGRRAIYRVVHEHADQGGGYDQALWLEWVD